MPIQGKTIFLHSDNLDLEIRALRTSQKHIASAVSYTPQQEWGLGSKGYPFDLMYWT